MTKLYYTLLFCCVVTLGYSQKPNNLSIELIGKWSLTKSMVTSEKKQEVLKIEDVGIYEFNADSTYTLTCKDLWGKARIVGKWKHISSNKFYLYDITHISEVKGDLPVENGHEVELKTVDKRRVLYISSLEFGDLYELLYERIK